MWIALWIGLSLLVGYFGKETKVGFAGGVIISLLLSPLIGLLVVLLSSNKEKHEFLAHKKKAEKLEYVGKTKEAILAYKEALFHLENDYSKPDKARSKLIDSLKSKVQKLEGEKS